MVNWKLMTKPLQLLQKRCEKLVSYYSLLTLNLEQSLRRWLVVEELACTILILLDPMMRVPSSWPAQLSIFLGRSVRDVLKWLNRISPFRITYLHRQIHI